MPLVHDSMSPGSVGDSDNFCLTHRHQIQAVATSSSPSESDFKAAIVFKEIAKRLDEVSLFISLFHVCAMEKMKVGGRALITPGKEVGTICAGL